MPASGHRDDCGAERYEPDAKTEVNWQGQEAGDDAEDTDCGKLSVHVPFLVGVRERLRGGFEAVARLMAGFLATGFLTVVLEGLTLADLAWATSCDFLRAALF